MSSSGMQMLVAILKVKGKDTPLWVIRNIKAISDSPAVKEMCDNWLAKMRPRIVK